MRFNNALQRLNFMIKLCSVFCLFSGGLIGYSQTKPTLLFKHLTLEDGLSDPAIRALHIDRNGFLWVGTENGLNRFDGTTCYTYKNINNSKNFPGNYITNIIEDSAGNLIIGSQNNLVKYNRQKDNFTSYKFPENPHLKDNYYSFPFYIDHRKDLWVYLAGNIYRYSNQTKKTQYITTYSNGFQFVPIPFYHELDWFISRGVKGIYINKANDTKEEHVQKFLMNNDSPSLNSHVEDVYVETDTSLWLGTDKGLILLNPKTKSHQIFSDCKTNKKIIATAIAKYPNQPWLLVGTRNDGLLLFNLVSRKFFGGYSHESDNSLSLSGNYIRRIYIDQKQNLFIGIDGHGLDYTNLNKVIFTRLLEKTNTVPTGFDNDVVAMLRLKNGQLWCGTKNGGLHIYLKDLKKPFKNEFAKIGISKLVETSNGDVLLELADGRFFLYESKIDRFIPLKIKFSEKQNGKVQINQIVKINNSLFAATEYGVAKLSISASHELLFAADKDFNRSITWPNIQRIIPFSKDEVLVQTYYTSLYSAKLRDDRFVLDQKIAPTPFGINGNITIDETIYLGTSSGLIRFNTVTKTLDKYSLLDANCTSILADRNNNLWLGTNHGLYFYEPKQANQTRYVTADGLQSMVFNINSALSCNDGLLYFGGINGINVVNPLKAKVYTGVAKPQITSILINDKRSTLVGNPITISKLNLKHNQNTITIAFSPMDFTNPKQRKIVYQMVGYDDKKITVTGSNSIRFPNMPSGKFKLVLVDVYSNKRTELPIYISAPFWQKWWFLVICLLSLIIISFMGFVIYLRWIKHLQILQLRQMINFQKADRKRIADDLHDDVGLRLSSLKHYLLAGDINKMIDGGELRKLSSEYIDQAVSVLRSTLINLSPKTIDEHGLITALEDLIENINKLKIITIHFDYAGFNIALKSTQQYSLYRICQELINNTIKHAGAKNIYIAIINRDEKVIILYEDDGMGYDTLLVKRGYGLYNIEAHIKAIKADLAIDTQIGKGVAVTITINLKQILKFKNGS